MMLMLFRAMRLKKKKMRRMMDEVEVAVKHKTCQFWRLDSALKVGRRNTTVLGKVDTLRKKVMSVGKEHASLCAKVLEKSWFWLGAIVTTSLIRFLIMHKSSYR